MDPREFLNLATELVVVRKAGAAHFRGAIGRAYYATLNRVTQILGDLGFPAAVGPQVHGNAVRLLQQSGDNALQIVGGLLSDLHGDRIKADYDLERKDVEKMTAAQSAVETAVSIFKDLDGFAADLARRSAVTAALNPRYKQITGKSPPTHQ